MARSFDSVVSRNCPRLVPHIIRTLVNSILARQGPRDRRQFGPGRHDLCYEYDPHDLTDRLKNNALVDDLCREYDRQRALEKPRTSRIHISTQYDPAPDVLQAVSRPHLPRANPLWVIRLTICQARHRFITILSWPCN